MPTKIEVGSEWFFLPKAWLDKWEAWCYVDVITCPEIVGLPLHAVPLEMVQICIIMQLNLAP